MEAVTSETKLTHSENSCWNRCMSSKCNPKNWDVTSKKVAQTAAIILATCIAVIVVSTLMVQFPQFSGAFFAAVGVVAFFSLITLIVGSVKYCKQNGGLKEGGTQLLHVVKEEIKEGATTLMSEFQATSSKEKKEGEEDHKEKEVEDPK